MFAVTECERICSSDGIKIPTKVDNLVDSAESLTESEDTDKEATFFFEKKLQSRISASDKLRKGRTITKLGTDIYTISNSIIHSFSSISTLRN